MDSFREAQWAQTMLSIQMRLLLWVEDYFVQYAGGGIAYKLQTLVDQVIK